MKLVNNNAKSKRFTERMGSQPTISVFSEDKERGVRIIIGTPLMRISVLRNPQLMKISVLKKPQDVTHNQDLSNYYNIYDCNSSIIKLNDKLLFMRGRRLTEYDYKIYRRSDISFTNSSSKKTIYNG